MSFFGTLVRSIFGGGGKKPESAGGQAFWIYVRCDACGEKIRVRVNREHDLSAEFDGSDFPSSYHARKEIVGSRCFRRINVDLEFNGRRQLTDQSITGGTFITAEEYEEPEATGDAPAAHSGTPGNTAPGSARPPGDGESGANRS